MDICLVINTCKAYYTQVKCLIAQIKMLNSALPTENILIVSGQEDENSISYIDGIKIVKVMYTGLHLTSSIYIYENIREFEHINYWILLPDTIKFGNNFFNNIISYYTNCLKNKDIYSVSFVNPNLRPTMDIGIVHTKHIINMSNYLKQIKIYDINKESLIKLKKQLIYDENTFLGFPPSIALLSTKFNYVNGFNYPVYCITNKPSEFQTYRLIEEDSGTKIQAIYFKNLDFYKFQRNFIGPDAKLIMTL